ncbi:crotonobetainyl-CoA--carnitine CoA-transferase [Flavihumibacter petaseus]|uniref:alpha-L-fucosidase n=1 Tax=Flavihumibacter petaseus NBRC 106054 TaxID=1220578 RepID=A0A0E9MZG9_9BACT|nr:crotonobetainyl-CoA--carnitine CoA-transferase [Flavihumibacter petaseus]GAO42791.1 putative glycosidase [Flavihumibacter petaseus NBRC 106054]
MNKRLWIMALFALIATKGFTQIQEPGTKPNAAQAAMIKRGYGMFMHFGLNTFTDDEWSDGTTPVEKYNPTHLDPDQWVRTARDAGFRYVLLITKHHDGFCLWDSKYTTYDVGSAPVKTDVVKAVSEACKKYGLQFAIYYSLWDRHEPSYKEKDPQQYINYMLNQLTELFTNYGTICELWLDGGWDRKPGDWGVDQVYKLVKKYNPACAVSVNHTIVNEEGQRHFTVPSNMTEDNKYFFQYFPSDFRLWDPKLITKFDKKQYLHQGKSYYMPFEHTICLSKRWNWFQKSVQQPVRDQDELEELFYWCTDNDNSLVVNVPPDASGRIREYEANAVIELGKRLGLALKKPLPKNGRFISFNQPVTASSSGKGEKRPFEAGAINDGKLDSRWEAAATDSTASLVMNLDPSETFNKISIFEYQDFRDLPDGFSNIRVPRIQEYAVDIEVNGGWETIFLGDQPMGDCKVIRLPRSYATGKLRFRVIRTNGTPSINEICVINTLKKK